VGQGKRENERGGEASTAGWVRQNDGDYFHSKGGVNKQTVANGLGGGGGKRGTGHAQFWEKKKKRAKKIRRN